MSRYRIDGKIVDMKMALKIWTKDFMPLDRDHPGFPGEPPGDSIQQLCLSSKNNYYVVIRSNQTPVCTQVKWVTPHEAAAWLLYTGEELPEDLRSPSPEIVE